MSQSKAHMPVQEEQPDPGPALGKHGGVMSASSGFTLVEVLIAGAIMAVALIPLSAVMVTATATLARSGQQTSTAVLAEQRLEFLRNQAFTSGTLSAGTVNETLTGTYAGYTRSTTIVDNTPRAGTKTVTVVVTDPAGRQVSISSRISAP